MKDIRYDFERMEAQFWDLQLKGIDFWHMLRMSFYELVVEHTPGAGASHPDNRYRMPLGEKLKLGVGFLWGSLIRHPAFRLKRGKDYLIVNMPRKVLYRGRYICPLIEPALTMLQGNYNYIERPEHFRHVKDSGRKCLAYSDYMELKRLWNQVTRKYVMDEEERKRIDEITAAVEETFGIQLDRQQVYSRVNSCLTGYFTYYKEYVKLLRKLKPKYILEVTHYENSKLSLNQAAHEQGIKVCELQHGVMNVQYDVPCVDAYMPDELLTFGEYWNKTTSYPGKMVAVGNPHLEECVRDMRVEKEFPTVLVISGGPVAHALVELVLEMERYCRERHIKIRILYKLHPNEYKTWRRLHPQLESSSVEVIDNNEKDLYYYFSLATHQIGVSSTAIYEGMAFDVKTIIFKAYRYDMMMDLVEKGYACLAEDCSQVMDAILEDREAPRNMEGLWMKDAAENMKKALLG